MPERDQIAELLFKYLRSELSHEDEIELNNWRKAKNNEAIFQKLTDPEQVRELMKDLYSRRNAWNKLLTLAPELKPDTVIRKIWWRSFSVAAAIFLFVGLTIMAGTFIFKPAKRNELPADTGKNKSKNLIDEVHTVSNKAILTLSNGKEIFLGSANAQSDINSLGNNIEAIDSSKLIYTDRAGSNTGEDVYNVLRTPRGGQYRLSLPDGSQVWLNAASMIKYPISFSGDERKVEVEGEAYFEVVKDINKSFTVSIGNKNVRVLGTHFNINSYSDEPTISVTLFEGSIQLHSGNQIKLLKPGQQARMSNISQSQNIEIVHDTDINAVISWRNGRILFKDADVQSIMRIVSRWYNLDVIYEGNIPERTITGGISKNESLPELLKVLEWNKIHFTFSNNQIIIKP